MAKKSDWIGKAVNKKDSFTKYCKSKGYKSVTEKCIDEGKKSKNSKTRKRANLASTFRKMSKK